ncbi:MAG: hypothetical protein IPK15_16560 [Verrucomicrobia bacterium]|nr:hypothetical protein [Verrucomicrobiota bacterium]
MTTRRLHTVPFLLCAALILTTCASALAQGTNAWTNVVGGSWHAPANWSLGVAPAIAQNIVAITNFNSKTVTADATTPAANLSVRNLILGALQNRQNTLVLTNLAAPLQVTRGLTMTAGGALQVHNSELRVDAALGGQVTMTAASASFVNSSAFLSNSALLKIGNGAGLSSINLTNSSLLTDHELRVGAVNRSLGRLNLAEGRVEVGLELYVGDEAGSTGVVTIASGTLQALNTNVNTRIGHRGNGSMIVSNGLAHFDDVSVGRHDTARGALLVAGGEFACGTLSIGRFSNAVGMVTVAGGFLNVADGSLYVGREGNGSLTNLSGRITASRLIVPGATNTATGLAQFLGGESIFTSGLNLGSQVSTGLVVLNGGALFCTNATATATSIVTQGELVLNSGVAQFDRLELNSAAGRLQFIGGTLRARDLIVNNGAPFVLGDGVNPATLELDGGTVTFANGIVVSPNATLAGCGTLTGNVTVLAGGSSGFQPCGQPQITPITLTNFTSVTTGIRFSFNSDAGVNYLVEFKNDLAEPAWQPLATLAGNGSLLHVTNNPAATGARFFQVKTP